MDVPFLDCAATLRPEDLAAGTWLVVLRADAIPHLALLQDGTCYSLEIDGNRRRPAAQLARLLEARRVPALLCRLAAEAPPTVAAFFAPYARITSGGNCFLPVRDYCASFAPETARCTLAFELVEELARAGRFERTVGLNLASDGARFVLPRYTAADVEARLDELGRGAP